MFVRYHFLDEIDPVFRYLKDGKEIPHNITDFYRTKEYRYNTGYTVT